MCLFKTIHGYSLVVFFAFVLLVASLLDHGQMLVILGDVVEEVVFDFVELLLKSLRNFLFVDLILGGLLVQFCLLLCRLQVLLSSEFTLEDLEHDFFFLGLQSLVVQGSAQAHHGDGTVGVTDGGHLAHNRNRGQNGVTHLLGVGNLVLAVEDVPNVEESVHSGEEEETRSGGGPATVSQVGVVVTGLHNGGL